MKTAPYYHVDVFSKNAFSGNGLTIFTNAEGFNKETMQMLTNEMRQFESIFLYQTDRNSFRTFIFTMEEELDFAGHPLIGAAALLHDLYSNHKEHDSWNLQLNTRTVVIQTVRQGNYYSARMNQGRAEFRTQLSPEQETEYLGYLNLNEKDKAGNLPFQVITTGLPYLILPVKTTALPKVKVTIPDLESKLEKIQAKFFYVLDVEKLQGRTWDNFGIVEDVATGSAAGPVGAFLVKNNLAIAGSEIILRQGDFLGRPSKIQVTVSNGGDIFVQGDVCMIARGEILVNTLPDPVAVIREYVTKPVQRTHL
jgi:trans-2,3-dihydro-3-hydroxyanthranilate isomerase